MKGGEIADVAVYFPSLFLFDHFFFWVGELVGRYKKDILYILTSSSHFGPLENSSVPK